MNSIETRLHYLKHRIQNAELHANRPEGSTTLIAVSKSRPLSDILKAGSAGQRHFAENYLQESFPKIMGSKSERFTWHFIGKIQSNKAKWIAEHFDWIHSVDRLTIAHRLNQVARKPLQICLQINIFSTPNQSGITLEEWPEYARAIQSYPNLCLRGIMCIAPPNIPESTHRQGFAACRQALIQMQWEIPSLDTLSMGMSDDLELAILEGSTQVRVGRALFGSRD